MLGFCAGSIYGSYANEVSKGCVWGGGCERGNLGEADPEPGGGEQKIRGGQEVVKRNSFWSVVMQVM